KAGGVDLELERINAEEILLACEKIERVGAAERSHRIFIDAAPDLFVRADGEVLRRVVCTIVENAVKYTPEGGLIALKAYQDEPGKIGFIEISDNGRGIMEGDLPYIFGSFYRGRNGKETGDDGALSGVGLGLYLARSLVEAMGGKISVVSQIGKGSKFTICLPTWQTADRDDKWIIGEKSIE